MSRSVSYPTFVEKELIKLEEFENLRYWLKIPFINKGKNPKTLCVILKNPSVATDSICDNTVSKVCNVARHNGYSKVIILNLFPYRSTKAKGIINFYNNEDYEKIMEDNISCIKDMCKNNDVVFAWGTNTISKSKIYSEKYKDAIEKVSTTIKENIYHVQKNDSEICDLYPLHGLRWHNDSSLTLYKITTSES